MRYAPLGGGINEPASRGDYEPRAPSDVGRCASRRSTFSHQPSSAVPGRPDPASFRVARSSSASRKRSFPGHCSLWYMFLWELCQGRTEKIFTPGTHFYSHFFHLKNMYGSTAAATIITSAIG